MSDVREIAGLVRDFLTSNPTVYPLCPQTLGDEDPLLTTGILDSLGLLTLTLYLENRLGVRLALATLVPDDFASVSAVARLASRALEDERP